MSSQFAGSLTIQLDSIAQQIALRAQPRRYGGVQWYFICPATGRTASVLWRPPGATRFCSRQTWGRQVAYTSQCLGKTDQAHRMMNKIKMRLSRTLIRMNGTFRRSQRGCGGEPIGAMRDGSTDGKLGSTTNSVCGLHVFCAFGNYPLLSVAVGKLANIFRIRARGYSRSLPTRSAPASLMAWRGRVVTSPVS